MYKNFDTDLECEYKENTINLDRDDKIIYLMIDSIRIKLNKFQQDLQLKGIDKITKEQIIEIYLKIGN